MSNGIFSNFTGSGLIGNYDAFKDTPKVDYNPPERKKTRKDRYRDAVDAASKFKDTTDYKARREAKENEAAQKATMKIADDISVMEGYQDQNLTSLRGTLIPAKTLNTMISKIPVIGDIVIPKEIGEGLFGISFKMKGPKGKIKTTVNPIRTLTPRFIQKIVDRNKTSK